MPAVLDRSELEASPLADLHAIADQLGLDGFRRLRKADLIDRILGGAPAQDDDEEPSSPSQEQDSEDQPERSRRRGGRSRRPGSASRAGSADTSQDGEDEVEKEPRRPASRERAPRERAPRERSSRRERSRSTRDEEQPKDADGDDVATVAEGVVEVLGNGSGFLRIDPPEPSDADVYISAAQVRRCELVSGDRVSGPARTPRRSERYPSLVRIDTINGASADSVAAGARYEDLPVDYPSERIALESKDPTLEAIEWLTPFGRGSRVTIAGAARAGKTETLRGLLGALSARDGLEVSLVVAGARPEEIAEWQQGPLAPAAALSFGASSDSQSQAVERALDAAKRVAARGGDAVVLIDTLDGLNPQAARKALASARNLREGGSLTVIATATQPFGGESTVIALDVALTSTGRQPILDLAASGTLKPELLVGNDGAQAITQARASALDAG
ncbi:MAG: transcription termination factor Rho [Solirubrobacteraceae bacterium]|nr:transcription termination factor Rho [Solirubrobacteraceae bacterium]MEA2335369.1 transcription termination factor Rho [Solirubrobacteraceae bacterium]